MVRRESPDANGVQICPDNRSSGWLAATDFEHLWLMLAATGLSLPSRAEFHRQLSEISATYESQVEAISRWLLIPLPAWLPEAGARDDWQTGMQQTH